MRLSKRILVGMGLILALFVAMPVVAGTLNVGNPATDRANSDGWISNLVIDEAMIHTNTSGAMEYIWPDRFNFYVEVDRNRVTPFLARRYADNSFIVMAVGTTRVSGMDYIGAGAYSVPFAAGDSPFLLQDGQSIVAGFLDANPDGSESGSGGGVVSWDDGGNQIWYTGGTAATNSGKVVAGQAPTAGASTYTTLSRVYSYNIEFDVTATAPSAPILWLPSSSITGTESIDLSGTLADARNLGVNSGTIDVTAGAEIIPFQTMNYALITEGGHTASTTFFVEPAGFDVNFASVLDSFSYDGPNPGSLLLTDLTPGQAYQIQLFTADDRSCCGSRTQNFSDTNGNSSNTFAHNQNMSTIGRFVAADTSQLLQINGVAQAQHILNAYVLREVELATIDWQTPLTITSVDDIDLTGTLVEARDLGPDSGVRNVVVGTETVPFEAMDYARITEAGHHNPVPGGDAYVGDTGDANFNAILESFSCDGPNPGTLTLTDLTIGQQYQIQLFASDDRSCCSGRTQSFGDGLGNNSATFAHADSVAVIGTFTATTTTQTIQIIGVAQSQHVLNAYVLRTVPEPTGLALAALGLLGVVAVALRRRAV